MSSQRAVDARLHGRTPGFSIEYTDPLALTQAGYRVAWIYHGGNGSSYQILNAWVADHTRVAGAIALPFHVEQHWNATRLAALGAVCSIHSFHRLAGDVGDARQAIATLRATALPPPPPPLVHEIAAYADSAQRAARELGPWL